MWFVVLFDGLREVRSPWYSPMAARSDGGTISSVSINSCGNFGCPWRRMDVQNGIPLLVSTMYHPMIFRRGA